jgi:hypothetical protein
MISLKTTAQGVGKVTTANHIDAIMGHGVRLHAVASQQAGSDWLRSSASEGKFSTSTRTARTTPCSPASGISAASMTFEAAPSIYGSFGRCTSPASRRAFAQITAWPRLKRQRRSSRRAGGNGWRGRSSPSGSVRRPPAQSIASTPSLSASLVHSRASLRRSSRRRGSPTEAAS